MTDPKIDIMDRIFVVYFFVGQDMVLRSRPFACEEDAQAFIKLLDEETQVPPPVYVGIKTFKEESFVQNETPAWIQTRMSFNGAQYHFTKSHTEGIMVDVSIDLVERYERTSVAWEKIQESMGDIYAQHEEEKTKKESRNSENWYPGKPL